MILWNIEINLKKTQKNNNFSNFFLHNRFIFNPTLLAIIGFFPCQYNYIPRKWKNKSNVINCQSNVVICYSTNFIFLIKLFHKTRRKEWYRDEKSNFINRGK